MNRCKQNLVLPTMNEILCLWLNISKKDISVWTVVILGCQNRKIRHSRVWFRPSQVWIASRGAFFPFVIGKVSAIDLNDLRWFEPRLQLCFQYRSNDSYSRNFFSSRNTHNTNIGFSYPEGTCIFHTLNNGTSIQVRKQWR